MLVIKFLVIHCSQIEIVRFSTDNDSIGEVLCRRAEAVDAVAVIMASHNKVAYLCLSVHKTSACYLVIGICIGQFNDMLFT